MKRVAFFGTLMVALAVVFSTRAMRAQQEEVKGAKKNAPAAKEAAKGAKGAPKPVDEPQDEEKGAKESVTDKSDESLESKVSYAIGFSVGNQIRGDGLEVDLDQLMQGFKDAYGKKPSRFSQEELRDAMSAVQRDIVAKRQDKLKTVADKNRKEGKAFLDANKAKKGIQTLPSGLQYQVLKSGNGPTPKATDTVKTHYHGTLIDGTVFDSSVEREDPAVFPVNGVIRGWTEALQKMKVGDKWKLFVPPELAYGSQGAGNDIGPDAVLIFEVELLGIEK